jgi:ABC-type taurine transport system ATPase subunit
MVREAVVGSLADEVDRVAADVEEADWTRLSIDQIHQCDQRRIGIGRHACCACFMLMLDRKLTAKATEVATRRREQ